MPRSLLACVLLVAAAVSASGQACPEPSTTGPSHPSAVREVQGQLLFHDDIRQWFELKLEQPQCGQTSVQIVANDQTMTQTEILRGCRVRSRGDLDYSHTGYFSLDIYQVVQAMEPIGECQRQAPFPDYSKATPDSAIRAYRVDMTVNYTKGDHPIIFRVTSAGRELRPWQAYASYWFTGGFVLYGQCGQGFAVDKVSGTPEAHPGRFDPDSPDDMAMFDPESAAAAGKHNLQLSYTCRRNP